MLVENLGTLFSAHRGLGRLAIVDAAADWREHGYDEIDDSCNAVARGLVARGCRPGDRIGILSLNRAEFVETLFGAMRVGCVPVPISTKLTADGVDEIARDASLRILFVDAPSRALRPSGIACVDFDDGSYSELRQPGAFEAFRPTASDVSLMLYTSGSSGRPKGVLQSHVGAAATIERFRSGAARRPAEDPLRSPGQEPAARPATASTPTRTGGAALVQAPLYHKTGLRWLKSTLAIGRTVVLLPRFDARTVIAAIPRYEVLVIGGTPTALALLLEERELLDSTDLSSVKRVLLGGAPMSRSVLDGLRKYFPIAEPKQFYGTTESGIPFVQSPGAPIESVGRPAPGVEVSLVRGPSPDEGVLCIKGPQVMLGYHNRPEETAERLRDGWYDTGDVFRRDAEGNYFFVRRADDMIRCGGEKVYPREVEALLEGHDEVLMVAVIGVDDALCGQVPVAFVVRRPGATTTEECLKAFALANGPKYAHPRRIYLESELPLLPSGKIDKVALKARVLPR